MKRWMGTLRAKATLGAVAIAGCLATWLGAAGSDSPEARELKDQLLGQSKRIESLEVLYKLDASTDLKPDQLRGLSDFHNQLFLPNEQRREAFKGEKRYSRQIQPERVNWLAPTDAHGLVPPEGPKPTDPEPMRASKKVVKEEYDRAVAQMKAIEARGLRPRRKDPGLRDLMEQDVTRGLNGRSLWTRRPITDKADEYQIWSPTTQGNWFNHSAYQAAIGFHSLDPTAKGAEPNKVRRAFRVAEWISDQSYALEEKTEVIDGSTCLIMKGSWNSLLKPSMIFGDLGDRIWLDRDHGLAVRKRELSKDGLVMQRWENSEFREVEPGLWLPTSSRHLQFAADAPPDWKGKPVLTEQIRVESVEVNRVADELFDMPVPKKGDRVEDFRGRFKE